MNRSSYPSKPIQLTDLGMGGIIALIIIGVWFIGDFHGMHDGDSLIHSLNSLYQWTVFVWEYDHIGSVLSFLARIIHRPYWNVLAISALSSLLFLTGLALWGSLLWPITFTESSLWVALLLPLMMTQHAVFQIASHSIVSGVALFFSGCYVYALQRYLHSPKSQILIPILLVLAFLVTYLSKIAFIPMAAVTCGLLWSNRPAPRQKMVAISVCLLLVLLCYQVLEQSSLYRREFTLHLSLFPVALPRLLGNWGSEAMTGIFWLTAPILMVLYKPARNNPLFLAMCMGVLFQTLIIACSIWAARNGFAHHYLFDLSYLSLLAFVGFASRIAHYRLPVHMQRGLLIALGLGAIGLNGYTWHAYRPANPLTRMEQTLGTNTSAFVAAGCDIIVGDYWTAWPAMLAVNDFYYRNKIMDSGSNQPRRVYAITSLAASTEHLWRPIVNQPGANICSLAGDEVSYKRFLSSYTPEIAMQMRTIAEIGRVIVHRLHLEPLDTVTLDFDSPPAGEGWSYQETAPTGETFTWISATTSTLYLPLASDHDMDLEFRVFMAMAPDILESLTLTVNDQPILLRPTFDPGGRAVFQGTIPQSLLTVNPAYTVFTFRTNRTLIPQFVLQDSDDLRPLSLAFDWLHIRSQP